MTRFQLLILVWICCAFTNRAVMADEPTTTELVSFAPPKYPTTFPDDHKWSFELLGSGLGDVTNRHVQMGGLTGGVGYYIFDTVAIQLDVTGYGFSEGKSSGAAAGVTLGIRHHIFNVGKSSVFLDVAGGEIEASNNLPYGGTHLNNTLQFGFGVARPIAKNLSLMAGVRYFHISNASSEGGDRNPSVNAIQGVVGLLWRF